MYRSRSNSTGISVVSGSDIEVDGLPEFKVVLHRFHGADAASGFVEGLKAAGLGNTICYDWETGTLEGNKTVLVGYLDEPSPGNIEVIEHRYPKLDSVALAKSMDRLQEERAQEDRRQAAELETVRKLLGDVVSPSDRYGAGWATLTGSEAFKTGDFFGHIRWKDPVGPYDLHFEIGQFVDYNEGNRTIAADLISAAGFKNDGHDVNASGIDRNGVLAALGRLDEVAVEIKSAVAEKYRVLFEATMKMTASRRRFLLGGRETGYVHRYSKRTSKRATAGGVDIGATEINGLLRMGWIEEARAGTIVTEAGFKAASAKGAFGWKQEAENDDA